MIPNDQLERLRRLLSHRRAISANDLQYELGISRATLTRYIRHLRDTFGVPVVIDRELGGYRLESSGHDFGPQFELPGLWFTASRYTHLPALYPIALSDEHTERADELGEAGI